MTGAARTAAVAAVEHLRNLLNDGACQAIYEEASEGFRRLKPQRDWLRECEDNRTKLGTWQAFDAQRVDTLEALQGKHALADGRAVFAKGAGQANTGWLWNGGHPHLMYLRLRAGGEAVNLPNRRYHYDRDPPMRRPRRHYGV